MVFSGGIVKTSPVLAISTWKPVLGASTTSGSVSKNSKWIVPRGQCSLAAVTACIRPSGPQQ
jgi:hypothetical protein